MTRKIGQRSVKIVDYHNSCIKEYVPDKLSQNTEVVVIWRDFKQSETFGCLDEEIKRDRKDRNNMDKRTVGFDRNS